MRIPTYKNFNKAVRLKMLALFYIDTPVSKFIRADLNFFKILSIGTVKNQKQFLKNGSNVFALQYAPNTKLAPAIEISVHSM